MASFSLRSQRTGNIKEFSLLELLKLLGDPVNDEIILEDGEDVYNLSSFREIGDGGNSGGNSKENWNVETFTGIGGQDTFYFKHMPTSPLYIIQLNGINQTRDIDFSQNGREMKFFFRMGSTDALKFIYPY